MTTTEDRVIILQIAERRAEAHHTVHDVMTLAEALAIWVETRRFPAEATGRCRAVDSA